MTTLIPAPNACVSRATTGEQRPAERHEPTTDDRLLNASQRNSRAWGDMAVLCTDALHQRKLPFNARKRIGEYNPAANALQIMNMKGNKSLDSLSVAMPGGRYMPAKGESEHPHENELSYTRKV